MGGEAGRVGDAGQDFEVAREVVEGTSGSGEVGDAEGVSCCPPIPYLRQRAKGRVLNHQHLQRGLNLEAPRLQKRFGNEFRVLVPLRPLAKAS